MRLFNLVIVALVPLAGFLGPAGAAPAGPPPQTPPPKKHRATAQPKPPPIGARVAKRINITSAFQKRGGFEAARPPRLVDRGRLLYLGGGVWAESGRQRFLDTRTLQEFWHTAPITAYVRARAAWFPAYLQGQAASYQVSELLHYDRTDGVAGLLVEQRVRYGWVSLYYFRWNLRQNRIDWAWQLARRTSAQDRVEIKPIGYAPRSRRFYLTRYYSRGWQHKRMDILRIDHNAALSYVLSYRGTLDISKAPIFDPTRERAVLLEHGENRRTRPRAHLIDLLARRLRSFRIPHVSYGFTFGPQPHQGYVYSSARGQLWEVDLRSGGVSRRLPVGKLGHGVGWGLSNTLVVLRNRGLQFIDPATFKAQDFIPFRTLYSGFSHVQGSNVLPGLALIKNGDVLYAIKIKRQPVPIAPAPKVLGRRPGLPAGTPTPGR